MKLSIVSSGNFFSDYGGGQVYVRNIVDELVRRHPAYGSDNNTPNSDTVTTTVISFNKGGIVDIRDYKGINVYQVNNEESFRDALLNIQPDIVHANGEKLTAARMCKELNIPCIVTAHHGGLVCPAGALLNTNDEICHIPADYSHCLKCYLRNTPTGLFWYPMLKHYSQPHYCRIGQRLEKLPFIPFLTPIGKTGLIVTKKLNDWKELCQLATHFIAPSNAMADALQRNSCPKEKISVIPHGIPNVHSTSNSSFSVLRSPLIHFYYVGRINYVKGIHILLEAFSKIDNPYIRLHLIGGAGNKAESLYMNRLRRKYKKDLRIKWLGKVPYEKMAETTKEFHCLIHPTICLEIFGLDIAEALQQGKYVIATRCGGAEMQIHNEKEGLLVEPNNAESISNAIQVFIAESKCSNANVNSIGNHTDELINLYRGILYQQ